MKQYPINNLHLWNKSPYPYLFQVKIDRRSDDLKRGKLREYALNPTRLNRIMKVLQRKEISVMLGNNGFTISYVPNNLVNPLVFWDSKSL